MIEDVQSVRYHATFDSSRYEVKPINPDNLMTGYHARKLGSNPEAKPSGAAKPLSRQEAKKAVWTRLGIICSAAERRADDASREVMKFLKCQYLLSADQKSFLEKLSHP